MQAGILQGSLMAWVPEAAQDTTNCSQNVVARRVGVATMKGNVDRAVKATIGVNMVRTVWYLQINFRAGAFRANTWEGDIQVWNLYYVSAHFISFLKLMHQYIITFKPWIWLWSRNISVKVGGDNRPHQLPSTSSFNFYYICRYTCRYLECVKLEYRAENEIETLCWIHNWPLPITASCYGLIIRGVMAEWHPELEELTRL